MPGFTPPSNFAEVPPDVKFYPNGEDRPHCCIDWLMYLRKCGCHQEAVVIDDFFKHCNSHDEKKTHVGNGVYQGPFAFTITKSPKDPHTVNDMLEAVRKVMSQQTAPVIKYAWNLECKGYDEFGAMLHPHIHGMYETATGGRIPNRQWHRAWDLWPESEKDVKKLGQGFRGGFHRPVESEEAYLEYIKKDGGIGESKGLE